MREVVRVRVDKTRPAVVLTDRAKAPFMRNLSVALITSTIHGLSSEVPVGPAEGLDHDSVITCDNVVTLSKEQVGQTIGWFTREDELRAALLAAYGMAP